MSKLFTLPATMLPTHAYALKNIAQDLFFSELGWKEL